MTEKESVIKEKLKNEGIFNFASLYKFAHSWLKEAHYGVDEERYEEKIKGNAKEIAIQWKATRDVSDYFRFEHKIKFEIRNLVEVEAEIDGAKRKTNQGELGIEISANLVKDKDSKWDTSPFSRFTRDIYNKFIIPSRIFELKKELEHDARNFKEEIKSFLELEGRR
ncbi:hypothetical protein J4462_00335 [Candidatus Pacearchaeota archaeon]|nr:hypothetical protein [Candidatus Pacearchaeota archaeon]